MSETTKTLTWAEVVPIHASQSGISTRQGRVTSLLCNQAKEGNYADEVQADKIFYRVTSSTNPKSVEALKRMVGSADSVRVFEKLGVNRWLELGLWRVSDVAVEGEGTLFLLVPA